MNAVAQFPPVKALSICIATLNRGSLIGETLDSIISQAGPEIEIVVLDGGSKDNTAQVVADRQQDFPGLRYVRQDVNGGVDLDFDRCVGHATGEYCWLMSDDDVLKPGALAAVLKGMRDGPSLIVLNAEVRSADLSAVLQKRRLAVVADRLFGTDQLDELFVTAGAYLTFIGCVIIRRSVWLERDRETYYGTLFIHVGVIFQKALPQGALILADPLISIRYGNATWSARGFEIWIRKWPDLVWSLPGLSDAARGKVYPHTPLMQFKRLIFFRADGAYALEGYRKWIATDPRWQGMRRIAMWVALTPGIIISTLVTVYLLTVGRLVDPAWRVFLSDVVHSRYGLVRAFRVLAGRT